MPTPDHKITICGVAELPDHRKAGVDYLLTLLNPDETNRHASAWSGFDAKHEILRFEDTTMPSPEACQPHHIARLLEFGECVQQAPASHLLVHCHAGISRSTAAAAVLMCQHAQGREKEAFMRLRELRPKAWPNELVIELADEALARNGALVTALNAYRAAVDPDFA